MPACGSLGRFLGPTIGAIMFSVKEWEPKLCTGSINVTSAYETDHYMTDLIAQNTKLVADGTCPVCDNLASNCSNLGSVCNFDYPAYYFKDGCGLEGDGPLLGLVAVLLANLLLFCNYFYKHRFLPGQGPTKSGISGLETPINYGVAGSE